MEKSRKYNPSGAEEVDIDRADPRADEERALATPQSGISGTLS